MYPIPKHLKPYLIPDEGEDNCEFQVTGTLQCPCGCDRFHVRESNDGMLAELCCEDCGEEFLLFDAGKHGWNGFVCHEDPVDRTQPLWNAACEACRGDTFRVKVWISSQGREDYLAECGELAPEEDAWKEAFDWIQVSLTCTRCGVDMDNWLDFETM